MLRIGMLTSGGDCQALNATMRGVVRGIKTLITDDFEIYGFIDGYKGMVYGNYKKMKYNDFTGILNKGGTILGTSRMPFKEIDIP
ncbi:MAG: 6-phosphofructokinase, partial [Lachnospiraceae bacterium]|nr:6-phosphofructokinase [Lachnospiraceae bacterium]